MLKPLSAPKPAPQFEESAEGTGGGGVEECWNVIYSPASRWRWGVIPISFLFFSLALHGGVRTPARYCYSCLCPCWENPPSFFFLLVGQKVMGKSQNFPVVTITGVEEGGDLLKGDTCFGDSYLREELSSLERLPLTSCCVTRTGSEGQFPPPPR